MAATTNIEWADHTFNPWIGCTKVSPACDHCYAEALMDTRMGRVKWGSGEPRARTSPANWREPLAWNRQAEASGTRPFVFCASLADVFDNEVDPQWRVDLFDLIRATPHLTWLLLTKRPANIARLYSAMFEPDMVIVRRSRLPQPREVMLKALQSWPRNAAIGCTVVNQFEAERDIPKLLMAKQALNPAFAFLSIEPLLSPLNLRQLSTMAFAGAEVLDALTGTLSGLFGDPCATSCPAIDWIIVGGESGPRARPMDPDWVTALRDQCEGTDTVFNFKQWGGTTPDKGGHILDGQTHHDRPAAPPLPITVSEEA